MNNPQILYVMGVSGSGKTTIGTLLAQKINIPFFDGDDFHPASNIEKMSKGIPLNDTDRQGWLERLNELALENKATGAVIVCSALKKKYRLILGDQLAGLHKFVYLEGSYQLINDRLNKRENHFMPKGLLRSQFDTLEVPNNAIIVSIDQSPNAIVDDIIKLL